MSTGSTYTASGYGDNSLASLFAKEHLVPDFINENCSADASWKFLIGSNYMDKLNAGDILRFVKFDGEFEVRPKEWNGTRRYQDLGDASSICAQLCAPREIAVKRNTCFVGGDTKSMLDQLHDVQLANTMKRESQNTYRKVFNMIMAGTDAANKGTTAGANTRNINLGTFAAPLTINVAKGTSTTDSVRRDFTDVFGALQDTVTEQDMSDCGSCDWSFKIPEAVIAKLRYAVGDGSCCNWNEKIGLNQVDLYKDFLGSSVYAAKGNLQPMIPTTNGFKTPVLYSCPQVGHFAHGVSCATMDQEHDDQTFVITLTDGGVIVRPRLAAYAWVEVITK